MQHVELKRGKKSKYGYEKEQFTSNQYWTRSSSGAHHSRLRTCVDSHGGKDAVAFLLKIVLLTEKKCWIKE